MVGTIVQAVKSVAMPMTWAGSTPAAAQGGGDGGAQHLDVVGGHLQRPVGAEADVAAGELDGQRPVEHGVGVLADGASPSSSPSVTRTTTARPERVP